RCLSSVLFLLVSLVSSSPTLPNGAWKATANGSASSENPSYPLGFAFFVLQQQQQWQAQPAPSTRASWSRLTTTNSFNTPAPLTLSAVSSPASRS
ncbi:hypothetical protein BCR35DRAFT_353810, partial [Leucosporidium creatinivorum]